MHQPTFAMQATEARGATAAPANDPFKPERGLPEDFFQKEDGIYMTVKDPTDKRAPLRVCSPLQVKGWCRDSQGTGWGMVVTVKDPDGRWHEAILDASQVQRRAPAALEPLFDLGLQLGEIEKTDKTVLRILANWRPASRYERTDRLGWLGADFDAFVLGSGDVIGESQAISDGVSKAVAEAMHTRGTLEEWKRDVAERCAGNPLMVLALSTAFSGPLLSIMGAEGGGFHFRGPSSCGKSTLLRAAVSVWGAPDFKQSWRGTDNGIEAIAAACNNTLLALDELHEVDARIAGEIVYMLANGRGKARMGRSASADRRLRWTVPVLSSGELSLEDHMGSANRKVTAGQEVRLIDLDGGSRRFGAFDCLHGAASGRDFADSLQAAAAASYGLAGPAFVEGLMARRDQVEKWRRVMEQFCRICAKDLDLPSDGQAHRVLKKFALAGLAGELATEFGLTGWNNQEAWRVARRLFRSWYQERGGKTAAQVREAINRTATYLAANATRFKEVGSAETADAGWRDQDWFYIKPDRWREIHAGFDPQEAARLHKSKGLLRVRLSDALQYKMPRAVPNRPRVYAVRATVMSEN